MDVDGWFRWIAIALIVMGGVMNGLCLWAVAKRLDKHIKQGGHDGRN